MLLLALGPVTTSPLVRAAAARDYAPWDGSFRELVARVRARVLAAVGGRDGEHAALPLQGSGHFVLEAALRTFVPPGGKLLLPMTGQYADRLARLATQVRRRGVPLPVSPVERVSPGAVETALAADPGLCHLALVYSETATGIVHDVPALAAVADRLVLQPGLSVTPVRRRRA